MLRSIPEDSRYGFSIHVRPLKVENRLMYGCWKGDFVIVANNGSVVGTLVQRTTRLVVLAKLDGTTAVAAAVGFIYKLNEIRLFTA